MYDYEYEFDVLLGLRLLKLLHMINPDAMEEPLRMYPTLPPDEFYLIVSPVLWQIFDDMDYVFDEEYEIEWMTIGHSIIDRLYALGCMQKGKNGTLSAAWKKKRSTSASTAVVCRYTACLCGTWPWGMQGSPPQGSWKNTTEAPVMPS